MSRSTKMLLSFIGLGLAMMAMTSGAFAAEGIDPEGPVGYLRSQANTGAGLMVGGYFIGLGIAALGSAFGLARAAGAALEGIARQPEAAAELRLTMIIGAALIEALTIYALISPFIASIAGLTIK